MEIIRQMERQRDERRKTFPLTDIGAVLELIYIPVESVINFTVTQGAKKSEGGFSFNALEVEFFTPGGDLIKLIPKDWADLID